MKGVKALPPEITMASCDLARIFSQVLFAWVVLFDAAEMAVLISEMVAGSDTAPTVDAGALVVVVVDAAVVPPLEPPLDPPADPPVEPPEDPPVEPPEDPPLDPPVEPPGASQKSHCMFKIPTPRSAKDWKRAGDASNMPYSHPGQRSTIVAWTVRPPWVTLMQRPHWARVY